MAKIWHGSQKRYTHPSRSIDAGYRGEITVCLLNTGDESCSISKGDRIAQILFQEAPHFDLEVVEEFSKSDRGEGGFGSTGY